MKIDVIFDKVLYAFRYDGVENNAYQILMDRWTDTSYLYDFFTKHQEDIPKNKSIAGMVKRISKDIDALDDWLYEMDEDGAVSIDELFRPLFNQNNRNVVLAKQKAKGHKKSYLRIYALRIEKGCYVITGGAIKLSHLMEDRAHTEIELNRLEQCRQFLEDNRVLDDDSFYEFLIELDE